MLAVEDLQPSPGRTRRIGVLGTLARVLVGTIMVSSVILGHPTGNLDPAPFVLGLLVFPAMVLAWQWWRARRNETRVVANVPLEHAVTVVVFFGLYLTTWYAPALSALSDSALLFYGGSMLVATARGYAGCEVLAVSNWVLHRDDQVGCLFFEPVDLAERRWRRRSSARRPESLPADRRGG